VILKVRYWTTLFLLAGAQPGLAQTPAGFVPDDVRAYTAYRAPPGMAIDGRLDEDAWKIAPWTEAFVDIRDESHLAPTWEAWAKLLWDDEYLYIAAYLEEPHVWATLTERDAIIYHDHDFEVFLDPEGVTAVTHSGATLLSGLYLPDLTPTQLAEAIRASRNAGASGVSTFEMNGLTDEHLAVIRAAL